jgi:hypothetical protein
MCNEIETKYGQAIATRWPPFAATMHLRSTVAQPTAMGTSSCERLQGQTKDYHRFTATSQVQEWPKLNSQALRSALEIEGANVRRGKRRSDLSASWIPPPTLRPSSPGCG